MLIGQAQAAEFFKTLVIFSYFRYLFDCYERVIREPTTPVLKAVNERALTVLVQAQK